MKILYNIGLASLAVAAMLIALGPVLFVVASAGVVIGLFALAVSVAAVVHYAERWVDEGVKDYSFMEALDDGFQAVAKFLIRRIYAAKCLPAKVRALKPRFVAFLPILKGRARVLAGLTILPFLFVFAVVIDGSRMVARDIRGMLPSMRDTWING